ncbi:MAG: vWA domain-containing protein [Spirochaetaceae bacterium]
MTERQRAVIRYLGLLLLTVAGLPVAAQQEADSAALSVGPTDVRVEQTLEGGYNLFIRSKPGIRSVLITESTEAPDRDVATYAYRNPEYHPENGDERRLLDGEFIGGEDRFFLLDSTPVEDEAFGEAFKVFMPYVLVYGYSWTRSGEVQVVDGTYLSVRTFELPYADYTGAWRDNPFTVRITQAPAEGPPEGNFMDDTVESFSSLSEATDARRIFSTGREDIVPRISELIEESEGPGLDLVVALDTTQSMQDDLPHLQESLVPMLRDATERFDRFRIGFVLYRDYLEDYLTQMVGFEEELEAAQRVIDRVRVAGGRDLPEAVHEALYRAVYSFDWEAPERMVILIGDAPPHPRPRGAVTEEMVLTEAEAKSVRLHTIILPH